jgi:hypothetical protein
MYIQTYFKSFFKVDKSNRLKSTDPTVTPHSVYHGVLGSNPGGDRL